MTWQEWIKEYGVIKLAGEFNITRQAIYAWLKDGSNIPDEKKKKLIVLSGYRFTINDFFK